MKQEHIDRIKFGPDDGPIEDRDSYPSEPEEETPQMKLVFTLNDLKAMHDAVSIQEEISHDEPEEYPGHEHFKGLRIRLKKAIDQIENKPIAEVEVVSG